MAAAVVRKDHRGRQCRPSKAGKGIDVETELVLFRQHSFHKGACDCPLPACGAAAERRCAALPVDSAAGDQCSELILLLSQLVTQLKALQFSRETVADRSGTEAKPGIQIRGPVLPWIQISPQRSKDQISVLQGYQRRPRAGRRSSGSLSAAGSCRHRWTIGGSGPGWGLSAAG